MKRNSHFWLRVSTAKQLFIGEDSKVPYYFFFPAKVWGLLTNSFTDHFVFLSSEFRGKKNCIFLFPWKSLTSTNSKFWKASTQNREKSPLVGNFWDRRYTKSPKFYNFCVFRISIVFFFISQICCFFALFYFLEMFNSYWLPLSKNLF